MGHFDDFDREFARVRDSIDRDHKRIKTAGNVAFAIIFAWIVFLMGAIGIGLFLLGRWTGVW